MIDLNQFEAKSTKSGIPKIVSAKYFYRFAAKMSINSHRQTEYGFVDISIANVTGDALIL